MRTWTIDIQKLSNMIYYSPPPRLALRMCVCSESSKYIACVCKKILTREKRKIFPECCVCENPQTTAWISFVEDSNGNPIFLALRWKNNEKIRFTMLSGVVRSVQ